MFLWGWNEFAAKTEFRIVLEYFCKIGVGLRKFLSEEKREEKFGLRKFFSKKQKGKKELDLK